VDLHSVKFPLPLSTYWFSSVDLEATLVLTITSLCEYPLGAQGSTSVLFLEDSAIARVLNLKRYFAWCLMLSRLLDCIVQLQKTESINPLFPTHLTLCLVTRHIIS